MLCTNSVCSFDPVAPKNWSMGFTCFVAYTPLLGKFRCVLTSDSGEVVNLFSLLHYFQSEKDIALTKKTSKFPIAHEELSYFMHCRSPTCILFVSRVLRVSRV